MQHLLKTTCFCLLLLLVGGRARAEVDTVLSPSENLRVIVSSTDGTGTTYEVALKNGDGSFRQLISPSEVSMTVNGGATVWGKHATVDSVWKSEPREMITPLVGKFATLPDEYNELTIRYLQGYLLIVRAYDEGVAYRFVSSVPDGTKVYVKAEGANFNFAEVTKVWYPAMSNIGTLGKQENYERWYTKFNAIEEIGKYYDANFNNDFRWAITPTLFGFDEGDGVKVAITEADLHAYPTLYLERDGSKSIKGVWSYYPKEQTVGDLYTGSQVTSRADYLAVSTGPTKYPWRVVIVAENDKDLLTNQLVYKLSTPSTGDFSWVKPGKSTWEYWHDAQLENGTPSGWENVSYALYKQYIDFAIQHGLKFLTIDTDGQHNMPKGDLEKLVKYAEDNGIQIIKWDYIGEMSFNKTRLAELRAMGVGMGGVKIDMFYRSDQWATEELERVVKDAVEQKLLLVLHGCPVPHGLERTYPNIMGYEAVAGEENYKWDGVNAPRLPDANYHVEFPYIRGLVGPADFTPGSLRNVHKSKYEPKSGVPVSIGTRAHELAMYVVYDDYLVPLADNPTEYNKYPDVMKYLTKVPVVWDKTIALDGKVGQYIELAKQSKEGGWYIAGMTNDDAHTFAVDLARLGNIADLDYVTLYRDETLEADDDLNTNTNARIMEIETFPIGDLAGKLPIACSPEGGFVLHLYKKGSADDPEISTAVSKNKLEADGNKVLAYTNTNRSNLTVNSSADNIRAVRIFNVQGTEVVLQKYKGIATTEMVSISPLPSGVYFASVETIKGTYATKFFK